MSSEPLEALLVDLESDRVERTRAANNTDKLGEAICAFANDLPGHQQPGFLIIGVDDEGRPTGLPITDQLLQNLAAIRSDGNLLPQPSLTVDKVAVGGLDVAVITVQPSVDTPVRYKGAVWIRVGPRRGRAKAEDERILSERRASHLARSWDARPCLEASLEDLVVDLFTVTYRHSAVAAEVIAENDRSLEDQLAALRFYDLRTARPTNAGVLAFARDTLEFFPGAYVQYVRYGGQSPADEVQEERRISGDLLTIFRGLDELGRDLATPRPVLIDGFREETVFGYPPRALRELFANAVVHRNYESSATPIRIDDFTDRLEIFNPGGLHPEASIETFPRATAYRNPILAEAARVLGYANRFGRGVATAQKELMDNGSPPAEFLLDEPRFFLVTVRKRP